MGTNSMTVASSTYLTLFEKSSFSHYNNYHFSDSHEKELVSRDYSLSCLTRNETRLVTLLYCT